MRIVGLIILAITWSTAAFAQEVCVNGIGNSIERGELVSSLVAMGFTVRVTTNVMTPSCQIIVSYPGGNDNTNTIPLSWIQSGHGYVLIGASGASYIANDWSPLQAGQTITVSVTDPLHPLANGLPSSWQSRGLSFYASTSSNYLGYATTANVSSVADVLPYARAFATRPEGSGVLVYMGWCAYGSAATSDDLTALWNAVCFAGPPDFCLDDDGDGVLAPYDCDDNDPQRYPGNSEPCDGIDNDCDNIVDNFHDTDFDGVSECNGDCNDTNPLMNPNLPEFCDGLDNDCDGAPASDELDLDGDGWSPCEGDCLDTSPTVYPGAPELCQNSIDENCNGIVDEPSDADNDGFPICVDCDDTNPNVNPFATENCQNGIDDDCDGFVDHDQDYDGDGASVCVDCDEGDVTVYNNAPELCDGKDNNCDGVLEELEHIDADNDGYPRCVDCNDRDERVHPDAIEDPCGDVDANCDGVAGDRDACRQLSGCACSSYHGRSFAFPTLCLLFSGLLVFSTRRTNPIE